MREGREPQMCMHWVAGGWYSCLWDIHRLTAPPPSLPPASPPQPRQGVPKQLVRHGCLGQEGAGEELLLAQVQPGGAVQVAVQVQPARRGGGGRAGGRAGGGAAGGDGPRGQTGGWGLDEVRRAPACVAAAEPGWPGGFCVLKTATGPARCPPTPPDPLSQCGVCRVHVLAHPVGHPAVHQLKGIAGGPIHLPGMRVRWGGCGGRGVERGVCSGVLLLHASLHCSSSHPSQDTHPSPPQPAPPWRACPLAAAWPCAAPGWRPGRGHTPQTQSCGARSRAAGPRWRRWHSTRAPGLQAGGAEGGWLRPFCEAG